jgi:hypothetical protein
MKQRSPYFHIYMGLVVILASFAAGVTWQSVLKAKQKRKANIYLRCSPERIETHSPCGEINLKDFTRERDARTRSALEPIPLAKTGVHDTHVHFCHESHRFFTCKPSQE